MTPARFAAIDYWLGLKAAAAVALVPIAAVTAQQVLGLGAVAHWVYLWGACAALIAVLPRRPAWLHGNGWRSTLLIILVFALTLLPLLLAGGTDAHSLVGSGMIAGMFATVFAAAAWLSMQARQRREQAAAAALAPAAVTDAFATRPAASRTPAPPPERPR